ncbi:MAG: competence/damage-inducible protein A [Clostridiaceae bacterium]
MNAEIIAVGTEILLGDIINTNAQYLSKELAALGINVYRQTVVGDNEKRLLKAFQDALETCDLVITTGGLGPTADDITKETAAKFFGQELIFHETSWEFINNYFKSLGREATENNKKQAYFPKEAVILENHNGTAPGAIIKGDNNKTIIILPGPPKEMKPMFHESVVPYLRKESKDVLYSKVLRISGLGESTAEELIRDILEKQSNPTVAPYAKEADVILRITARAKDEEEAKNMIAPLEKEIIDRLGDNVYGEGEDLTMEKVVAELLMKKELTVAVAESCTGGMLASRLVNYPGIANVFIEGAVTYTNDAKMRRLGVRKETLDNYTAVSAETAIEMAEGIKREAGSDIGISTTGLAGPGTGGEDKPIGLVYAAISIKGSTKVREYHFAGGRNKIRDRAVSAVLDWLRRELINLK